MEGVWEQIYEQTGLDQGQFNAGIQPADPALGVNQLRFIVSLSPPSPWAYPYSQDDALHLTNEATQAGSGRRNVKEKIAWVF